jgi:hypothetical protein
MNVDRILETLNRHEVAYLLIGGMNFLLRHKPVLTFDVDVWIDDTVENRVKCETALAALDAQWGASDDDWKLVSQRPSGWLDRQALFCLHSPHGALDVFRRVAGLGAWEISAGVARHEQTPGGVSYLGLSDEDMLRCQYALEPETRRPDRITTLEAAIHDAKAVRPGQSTQSV